MPFESAEKCRATVTTPHELPGSSCRVCSFLLMPYFTIAGLLNDKARRS